MIKEKLKELRKAYRLESWPRFAIPRLKFRAKEKNIDFDLVPGDLAVPEFCSVLKIKLTKFANTVMLISAVAVFPSAPVTVTE